MTGPERRKAWRRADDAAAHEAARRHHALRLKLQSVATGMAVDPTAQKWAKVLRDILAAHDRDFEAVDGGVRR